jgi:hypothetical protein
MKVKFVRVSEDHKNSYGEDAVTLGKTYECSKISCFGSALIYDDYGHKSLLREGEYEVVEE